MNMTQTVPNHTHTFRSLRDVVTGQAHAYCVHIPCQVTFVLTETFEGERDNLDGLSQPAPSTGSTCPTCGAWNDPWGDHRRQGCVPICHSHERANCPLCSAPNA